MARRPVQGSTLQEEAFKDLPVKAIAQNPRNPRDHYRDVDELAASIKAVGLLTPLAVTRYEVFLTHYPDYEHDVAGFDWVALNGNRRLAALRELGIERVQATVVDHLGREGMMDEAVLADNIHNERLPLLREAIALSELKDKHGSQTAVATRLGKSVAYVNQRLGLLRLTDELQQALSAGDLSFVDARALSTLPQQQQAEQWQALLAGKDGSRGADDPDEPAVPAKDDKPGPDASARKPRPRNIRISTPDKLASSLREVLSAEELSELVRLLTGESAG